MLSRFEQFKRSHPGDPRSQVMQLLQSGKITDSQLQQVMQQAQQLRGKLF